MRRTCGSRLLAVLTGFAAGLLPVAGHASGLHRVAIVADVTVDGEPRDPSGTDALEALLADHLVTAGVRLVDPQVAQRIRAFVEAPAAVDGSLPAGVSSLDADWVLAARADCRTREERGMMDRIRRRTGDGTVLVSTNCTATVSLLRTDTAEVAGRQSLRGAGAAAYPHEAVRRALDRLTGELGRRHLDGLLARAKAERPVQIWLFAPPDRRAVDRLRDVLAGLDGAGDVAMVSVDDAMARLEMRHPGGGLALAAAVEGHDDLEVRVERATFGLLTLRWDPSAALSTRVHVRALRDATDEARLATRVAIVPGRLAALLAASPYLVPVDDPEDADLIVTGEVRRSRQGAFEVAVKVDRGGATVMEASSAAADPEAELAGTLSSGLPGALARHAAARRTDAWAGRFGDAGDRLAAGRAARRLEVTSVEVSDIFPARLASSAEATLGYLEVKPSAAGGEMEVVARASVVGLSAGPRLADPVRIASNDTARLPLAVTLDPQRLLARRTASGGQVQVELLWREGGAERSESFVLPIRIHERNAIDWREGETAAAFVTPRDPAIRSVVERALAGSASGAADLPPAVIRAARIVETLRARGLSYVPDPVVPFGDRDLDVMRFPGESIAAGQGDCSDLSVLLAASLEAAGIRTFLVTTPGHLLVAYDSGLPTVLAGGLGATLDAGGRALIPVEATALDRGYQAAVAAGVEVVGRRPEAVGLIPIRETWRRVPPAPVQANGGAPALTAPAMDEVLAGIVASRNTALAAAVTEAEAALARSPDSAMQRVAMARALVGAGRAADARRVISEAPSPGSDAAWWTTEANVLAIDGDLDESAARLEAALAEPAVVGQPDVVGALARNLAVIRLVAGDEPAAVAAMARALQADDGAMDDLGVEGLALARASGAGDGERVLDGDLARLLAEARRSVSERARAGAEDGTEKDEAAADAPQIISGGRRGDDPEARRELAAVLRWLEPAGGGAGLAP